MKSVSFAAALALVAGAGTACAQTADSVNGRWAANPAFCARWFGPAAEQPLIVSETALRWSNDSCRIGRMYKTGDTVHIQALCWDASGERSIPVSLRPRSGRLHVTWDRGARGELKRCP